MRRVRLAPLALAVLVAAMASLTACGDENHEAAPAPSPSASAPSAPASTSTPTESAPPSETPAATTPPIPLATATLAATPSPTEASPTRVFVFEPARDATLFEDPEGSLASGAGRHLFVGSTDRGLARRTLLAFDLRSLPPGARIVRAELLLHVSKTSSGPQRVTVHRLLAPWSEGASNPSDDPGRGASARSGDATWLHRTFASAPWATPGGDFDPAPSASLELGASGTSAFASTPALVADVQGWLDDPATNRGWIVIGVEGVRKTSKRLFSREHDDPAERPRLTIEIE